MVRFQFASVRTELGMDRCTFSKETEGEILHAKSRIQSSQDISLVRKKSVGFNKQGSFLIARFTRFKID